MSIVMQIVAGIVVYSAVRAISESFVAGWLGGVTCSFVTRVVEWSMS